jgi:Heavy metal associated domain 2
MFNLPPDAYISHVTSGRFRIRIPSKKGDAAFFQSLKELGGPFPNIHEVTANPVTGSILIKHSLEPAIMEDLARKYFPEQAKQIGSPSSNIHRTVTETYRQVDNKIKKVTGGEMDVGTLSFGALLIMGIYQITRGNFMAPAWYTAFWYAMNIFLKSKPKEKEIRAE